MSTDTSQRWRRFLGHWVDASARRAPWVVLLFALVGGGALYLTVTRIKVNTDRDKMLSSDLPFRAADDRKKALFPQLANNLVLVVDAATPEDARSGALDLARTLVEQPDLFEDAYVPRADPFLEARGLLFSSPADLDDLADRLAKIQPFLGRLTGDESLRGLFGLLEQAIDADKDGTDVDLTSVVRRVDEAIPAAVLLEGPPYRLSWQELMQDDGSELSPDERRQYVLARPKLDYGRLLPAGPALDAVRSAARDLAENRSARIRVRVTGGLAMAHEELQTVSRGAEWLALGVLLAVAIVLLIGLRSGRLVVASLATLLIGLMLTAGFATAAIGHLNLVSVAFGILYIGLGIDYAIHLCLRYREGVQAGRDRGTSLSEAAQDVGGSLVLCSISTALGFYAFVPTAYAGVSELGLISGTGMFISLLCNLTLLPALLTLLPIRKVPAPKDTAGTLRGGLMEFPVRRHRPVLVASILAAVVGLALVPLVSFDFNPLNLRDRQSESVATFDELLRTSDTPPWNLDALVDDEAAARVLTQRLEALPLVDKAIWVESFVPDQQEGKVLVLEDTALILGLDTMERQASPAQPSLREQAAAAASLRHALEAYVKRETGGTDRAAAAGLATSLAALEAAAEQPGAAARFDRLGESLLATLPSNLVRLRDALNAEAFTRADLPEALARRWVATDGTHRVQAFAQEDLTEPENLERFVAAVRTVVPDASGSPVVMLESGRAVAGAFRQALIVAVLATSLVLLLLLRKVRDVAFVLFPLLLAGLLTCVVMVLVKVPFNFANVIALPLLLGIGVDNGIHMVDRARHGRGHADANPLQTSTARAVIFSTLTTSLSFGQLALSPHPGTASMGLLLSVGMAWTLICTLVVIPALLTWERSHEAAGAGA